MRESSQPIQPIPPWIQSRGSAAETSGTFVAAAEGSEEAARKFQNGDVAHITGWRYWMLYKPIAGLLKLYYKTLRWELDEEDSKALRDVSRPVLFVTWHNRSLLVAPVYDRFRNPKKFTALISPSKAAAWEARFFESYGIHCARGSSSRRSIQATREMLQAHRNGNDIGISPDGPTGPLYECKRGAVMMARKTAAPLLIFGAEDPSAIRMRTWDKHLVPLPFSKVRLKARIVESADIFGLEGDADEQTAGRRIHDHLRALNHDFAD